MTVTTLTNKISLTGDGATLVFPFQFAVQQTSDMVVYVNGIQLMTGFVVALNSTSVGGTVTFTTAPPAPTTAGVPNVLLARIVPLTQGTHLPPESNIPEVTLENAYDKLTMAVQQLNEAQSRALSYPITIAAGVSGALPTPVAGDLLGWDSTGTILQNYSISLSGGGALGPTTTTIGGVAVWANTVGTLLGIAAPGTAGQALRSNGPLTVPTFQADPTTSTAQGTDGYRLSADPTNPEPYADVLGSANVYMIPFASDLIGGYNGTSWVIDQPGIKSIAIPANSYFRLYNVYWDHMAQSLFLDPFDVTQVAFAISAATIANPCVLTVTGHTFNVGDQIGVRAGTGTGTIWTDTNQGLDQKLYYVSAITTNTITLEGAITTGLTATTYTGATAYKIPIQPATLPVRQNGAWSRTGDLTKRWLGTFRTNGNGTLDDAAKARRLSNVHNLRSCVAYAEDTTASYTPSNLSTFYPRTGSIALGITRLEFVSAIPQAVTLHICDSLLSANSGEGIIDLLINRNLLSTVSANFAIAPIVSGFIEQSSSAGSGANISNSQEYYLASISNFSQHQIYANGIGFSGRNSTTNINGICAHSIRIQR